MHFKVGENELRNIIKMHNAGMCRKDIASIIGASASNVSMYTIAYDALNSGEEVPGYLLNRHGRGTTALVCKVFGFEMPKTDEDIKREADEKQKKADEILAAETDRMLDEMHQDIEAKEKAERVEQMQLNLDAQPQEAPALDIENLKEYLRNLSEALSIMNDSIETIKSTQRKELEMIMMLKNREPVEPNKCKKCGRTIPMGYSFCFECNKERLAK